MSLTHTIADMLRRSLQSLAGIGARSIQARAGCVANLPKLHITGFNEQQRSNAGDPFQHRRLAAAAAWRGGVKFASCDAASPNFMGVVPRELHHVTCASALACVCASDERRWRVAALEMDTSF